MRESFPREILSWLASDKMALFVIGREPAQTAATATAAAPAAMPRSSPAVWACPAAAARGPRAPPAATAWAELPALPISQAWHLRHDLDPAHHWLRGEIAAAIGEQAG
jgi:hypothetical protein